MMVQGGIPFLGIPVRRGRSKFPPQVGRQDAGRRLVGIEYSANPNNAWNFNFNNGNQNNDDKDNNNYALAVHPG